MADQKISELDSAATLDGTETAVVVQSGTTVKTLLSAILTYMGITLAPKASPTFTGTPAAPTAAAGTNTTQIATTAFATGGLATHEADTTSVHGITDTSTLYRSGGTDVALADGGTGASLSDPNADRILFWDDSAGATAWLTAGTGLTITDTTIEAAGGGAPTDVKYLTTASNGSLSAEVVIPGLGGSADRAGIGGGGITEEYDTGTPGLTWGTAPGTENSNSTYPSHLYTRWTATVSESLGTRAWAPGSGAFDARTKMSLGIDAVSNSYAPGFHIGDSGNSNRLLINASVNAVTGVTTLTAYTYASSTYTARGNVITINGNPAIYLRITRDGSNGIAFYYSLNGMTWHLLGTHSFTLTVDNIGYRVNTPAASEFILISDWLRTSV